MIKRRTLLQLGTLAAVAPTLAQASAKAIPFKFNLGWKFEASAAGYLLAEQRGHYREAGLDVTIDSGNGSAGAISLVASGAYDAASADLASLIEFKVRNPSAGLKAVAIMYDLNPNALITRKGGPIQKPTDFAGKRILGQPFNASRKLFPAFAQAQNFDGSGVVWENLDSTAGDTRFAKGDFDALAAFFFTGLLNLKSRGVDLNTLDVYRFSEWGLTSYGNGIIASQKAQTNPQALRAFVAASTRGWIEAIADPVAGAQAVKNREPLANVDIEHERLKLLIEGTMRTEATRTDGWGAAKLARIQATIDETVGAFGLPASPPLAEVWTDAYLPAAAQRRIPS